MRVPCVNNSSIFGSSITFFLASKKVGSSFLRILNCNVEEQAVPSSATPPGLIAVANNSSILPALIFYSSRGKTGGSGSLAPSKFTKNAQKRKNAQGSTLAQKRLFAQKRKFKKSWAPNLKINDFREKLGANFQMPKRSHETSMKSYTLLFSYALEHYENFLGSLDTKVSISPRHPCADMLWYFHSLHA